MEKSINKELAKYFFNKGIDIDMDNIVCKEGAIFDAYFYKEEFILNVDKETGELEIYTGKNTNAML